MIKKYLLFSILIMAVSFFISCSSEPGSKSYIKGDTLVTEGFIDDNTWQCMAEGAPNPDATGQVKRRTQAKEAALSMGQKRAMEVFKGYTLKAKSGTVDGESIGIAVEKEISGYAKGGALVDVTYDDKDNCAGKFKITGQNLKKKAEAGFSEAP